MTEPKVLEVFSDYVCPWCYLGSARTARLKKERGVQVKYVHFPLHPDTPQQEILPAKVTGVPFEAGEFIEFREPNAAGYGDPLDRPPDAVREDVLDDFTTIELARAAYGVVFADERTLEIDAAATEALRAELRKSRSVTSLTDYFAGELPSSTKPVSIAGNAEFGMT